MNLIERFKGRWKEKSTAPVTQFLIEQAIDELYGCLPKRLTGMPGLFQDCRNYVIKEFHANLKKLLEGEK
jgi:hypothetical protein